MRIRFNETKGSHTRITHLWSVSYANTTIEVGGMVFCITINDRGYIQCFPAHEGFSPIKAKDGRIINELRPGETVVLKCRNYKLEIQYDAVAF